MLISHTPLTARVLGMAVLRFFYTFLGSVGIGLAIGLISSLVRTLAIWIWIRTRVSLLTGGVAVCASLTDPFASRWCVGGSQTLKYIHFRNYPSLELALTLLFAYFPYVTAEGVGLSGGRAVLLAMAGCGATQRSLNPYRARATT